MDTVGVNFDVQTLLLNATGFVLTIILVPPGSYSVDAGFVSVDPFYPLSLLFAASSIWSAVGLWKAVDGAVER